MGVALLLPAVTFERVTFAGAVEVVIVVEVVEYTFLLSMVLYAVTLTL